MAITKIKPIKSTIKKAIDYIANPDKTNEQLLVTTYGCSLETADIEFNMTQRLAKQNLMEKGNNLAFHLVQSFKKDEIQNPDLAHEIGKQLANEILKGKYEYVLATHIDKEHIHNHLIFNATSFATNHKYISNKKTYYHIKKISDRICAEYGLSVIPDNQNRGKSYKEYGEYKKGTSWKTKLKFTIDKAIWSSTTYDEFLIRMQEYGYEVRKGKNLAFRAYEQTNFTNAKSVGPYYNEENILYRLEKNRHKAKKTKIITREVQLFIHINKFIKEDNPDGFNEWAKSNNLKEAAKTFNYLSENNLLNYESFKQKIEDISSAIKITESEIKATENELARQRLIEKNCNLYYQTHEIVQKEKTVLNKKNYRKRYAKECAIYKKCNAFLSEEGIEKIPDLKYLQVQIEKAEQSILSLHKQLQKLKTEQKTLDIVESNLDYMLNRNIMEKSVKKQQESIKGGLIE